MVRLGDVCSVRSGYAFKSDEFISNEVPIIRIGNVTADGLVIDNNICFDNDFWESNPNYRVNLYDVLVAMSGATVGKSCQNTIDDKLLLNQRVAAISCANHITLRYIYHAINSYRFMNYVSTNSAGCAQPNISIKQLSNFCIPLMSESEQKEVVATLDKLDILIDLRNRQLLKLDELIKSRFTEMFGDPLINDKHWHISLWSSVLSIKNGRNQKDVENPQGKYPICGSGGIMGYADNFITNENSVIVGRKGNINKPILMREKYWNVDTAFGLEPNTEFLLVDYLYFFCVFFDFETLNKAVTIPSLTKADLLNIGIPIPPIELQNEFATFVEQVDKSKVVIKKSLEKLETLKKSLMQEYFG